MASIVHNWTGEIEQRPAVVERPKDLDALRAIVRDHERFPSPARAVGSNHSPTRCAAADGGSLIDMAAFDAIRIEGDRVICGAGAIYVEVARALAAAGKQFLVNTEIGALSMGAAACCGTKDSSMPGEDAQISSYLRAAKWVDARGAPQSASEEDDPALMRLIRGSYGLFGILYEVTFAIKDLTPLAIRHEPVRLDDLIARYEQYRDERQSFMLFFDPYSRNAVIERRVEAPGAAPSLRSALAFRIRNFGWRVLSPAWAHFTLRFTQGRPALRNRLLGWMSAFNLALMRHVVSARALAPHLQLIDYPHDSAQCLRFSFGIWAFGEKNYPAILAEYLAFLEDYEKKTGFRVAMLNVAYRIEKDDRDILSYSPDGPALSIDPVAPPMAGWSAFVDAFNAFCAERGGAPLFNQTRAVTRAQARAAFGARLDELEAARRERDPDGRFLNGFFRALLGHDGEDASTEHAR